MTTDRGWLGGVLSRIDVQIKYLTDSIMTRTAHSVVSWNCLECDLVGPVPVPSRSGFFNNFQFHPPEKMDGLKRLPT